MKILVCDDDQRLGDELINKIRDAGQAYPEPLVEKDLTDALTKLFTDIRSSMKNPEQYKPADTSRFDDIDIVILDNNLTHLAFGTPLTAESIAGYIRAFTGANYVVSLNMNPDVDFDLRYLVGDFSTRADLALNTEHLANPGLWTGDRTKATREFLPWYWPRLATAPDQRRKQIAFVELHLDKPVVQVLGFDEEAIGFLSLHARGALSPEAASDGEISKGGTPLSEVTFRDVFIAKDRSLPFKRERERLSDSEKNGNADVRKIIARVVAADIDLWFRRDVWGPQEPLVDIPHLLMRFPFLLGDRAKDINEWNSTTKVGGAPYGLEQKLYDAHLAKAKFDQDIWVPTACFWWPKLKSDDKLSEYFLQPSGEWEDAVFCEDRSAFLKRLPTEGEPPVEFPAEFEGSWTRRYISRIEGIHYAPRSRLAL